MGIYLTLVLTPLFVMLWQPTPAGLGFWRDLSSALGFAGTTMMAIMFLLTARLHRVTAPFGIDIIYYFHRQIALVALFVVLAHPLILFSVDHELFSLAATHAPWSLRTGTGAVIFFLLLLATSLWRKQLGIHYDTWRFWHAIFAVLALLFTLLHIRAIGYYIATPWKGLLWQLIVLTVFLVLLFVRLIKPASLLRQPYEVVDHHEEVADTWTLILRPLTSQKFRFIPGQFAWLTIWHSPFALKEHPFSISSSAEQPDRLTFTIKALGDFTSKIGGIENGSRVYMDGPYGAFSCDRHPAPGYVFIAGGIGSAPIMSMLRTLSDRGEQCPIQFFYGGGQWQRLPFTNELEELRRRLNLEIVYVLEKPPPEWEGETGLITAELLDRRLAEDRKSRQYFICGPIPMMHMVEKGLHSVGVPLTHIHSELFDLV